MNQKDKQTSSGAHGPACAICGEHPASPKHGSTENSGTRDA